MVAALLIRCYYYRISDSKAGDGTTTSVLMTQAIVNQGLKVVKSGVNPEAIRRGIQKAGKIITDKLLSMARSVVRSYIYLPHSTVDSSTVHSPLMDGVITQESRGAR